jgi:CelD/BcsL family acetyltransferase involved in cellulose biosynthesis
MKAVGSARYTVETLRQIDSPEALASQWAGLPQAEQEFPQSADWSLTAAESLYASGSLRLIHLRNGEELMALAPLAIALGGSGLQRLEICGAGTLFEPCGFNYRDEASLIALCQAVVRTRRPIVLQRIAAEDALARVFKAEARGRGQLLQFKASGSPFVPITGDWDEYCRTLSSRRRQDYRRARRGLERLGKVDVDIQTPSEAEVAAAMAEAMRIEAASWKGRGGSAMLANPRLSGFFRQLTTRLARQGKLRLSFLRLDGVAIAMQVGAVHAGRWWVLKIGYDERWAEHSPGIQLMWDVLREAFERRLASFEMLGSAEPWLNIWGRDQRSYQTLAFYPYNGRGMVALGADIMRAFAQRLGASRSVAEPDTRRTVLVTPVTPPTAKSRTIAARR